jgi:predicted metal-dependent hydrolase
MWPRSSQKSRDKRSVPAAPRVVGSVTVGERAVPLLMRQSRRARQLSLRIDPSEDAVQLVLPRGVSLREGLRFAEEKSGWLLTQLARRPPRVPFAPGAAIPYLGTEHIVEHLPEARGGVWREAGRICVTGHLEFMPRRLRDWLRREAQELLSERAHLKATLVERPIKRLSLRDTTSRWGSCAHDGSLSFSWRLVLAPEPVLDYVVAHEVAHLVHHNHGPRFWHLVARLTPEMEASRSWLRRHGDRLLRYG